MALPELTPQQRADALERATASRRRRAEVKSQLKARTVTLSEVFDMAKEDDAIARMRVTALLESLPRIGPQRADLLLDEVGIAHSRRVRGLGPLQRAELIRRFG